MKPKQRTFTRKNGQEIVFNKEQIAVHDCLAKSIQVKAYAGSGKTALLESLCHPQFNQGIAYQQILVCSYSNQAVSTLSHHLPAGVETLTIHALGLQLITRHKDKLGFTSSPCVIEDSIASNLLADVLLTIKAELPRKDNGHHFIKQIVAKSKRILHLLQFLNLRVITKVKIKNLISRDDSYRQYGEHRELVIRILKGYRLIKKRQNKLDFGDMVRLGIKALRYKGHPYKLLLVDEYQDCSAVQVEFLVALAQKIGRAVVCCDPLQSIFRFAGGGYVDLETVLPGTETLTLLGSYRLTAAIAMLASAVVSHNGGRRLKLKGLNGAGELPQLLTSQSFDKANNAIFKLLSKLIKRGVPPSDICIIGRTGAQLSDIEQFLIGQGVSVNRLHEHRQITAVLTVLEMIRLLLKEEDKAQAIARFVELAGIDRQIPKSTLDTCRRRLEKFPLNADTPFRDLYELCKGQFMSLHGGRNKVDEETEHQLNRWEATAHQFDDVDTFEAHVKRMDVAPKVATSTVHGAKGGEWPYVIMVVATEGALPFFKQQSDEEMTEELNVMYVAITRAKSRLFLLNMPYINPWAKGQKEFTALSSFLTNSKIQKHLRI